MDDTNQALMDRLDKMALALANSQPAHPPAQSSWFSDNNKMFGIAATFVVGLLIWIYQGDRDDQHRINQETNEQISDVAAIVGNLSGSVQSIQQTQGNRTNVIRAFEEHQSKSARHNQEQDYRLDILEGKKR